MPVSALALYASSAALALPIENGKIPLMPQPAPASVTWSPSAIAAAGLTSSRDAELWLVSMGVDPEDVADDELPLRIAECKDKQEALSRQYSSACALVVPLASGSFAIFSLDRQQMEIWREDELGPRLPAVLRARAEAFGQRLKSEALHVERLREVGATEPSARQLAADLRRGARPRAERGPASAAVLEVSLDDL